jgi:transposase
MIQVTPQHHLFIHVRPIDFRKGIDGLLGFCRSMSAQNPFDGTWFVFRNHRGTAVKILVYDGTGFWLMHKRFSQGVLRYWPTRPDEKICATTLMMLLNQGEPCLMHPSWRELPSSAL